MIPKRVKRTQNEKRSPRNHNLELLLLPMRKIYQRSLYKKSYWLKNEPPMDLTSKNHNHNSFDQRLKWIQLPKITTVLIRDPNGSNFPKSQHFDQRPKCIQLPENLPRKQHFDEREREGGKKKKTEPEFDQVQGSGWDPQSVFYFILFRRSHLIGPLQIFLEHGGASPT